jgi:acetylornithine deacetylase
MSTIAPGDARALTRALVEIDSRNPSLVPGAPGEQACAAFLRGVLEAWGFRTEIQEAAPGRPNLIARIGNARGGRTLMFNGHLDVVGVDGMSHAPFSAAERDGRMYGRGSADMKGGIAAMCAAAHLAASQGIAGEIVVAAVADEEWVSLGTRALIERGVRADACVVTEPTKLAIMPAHRGFVWLEVEVTGRAAHGSRWDIGVDAIRHAGLLLAELDRVDSEVLPRREHPLLGRGSLHASVIQGGSGLSTYPERCVIGIERRTIPGETQAQVVEEFERACAAVKARRPSFVAEVRPIASQGPSDVSIDAPLVVALGDALRACREQVAVEGMSAWTDAALLNEAGIPAVCFGPGDISLAHAAEEYIPVDEIDRARDVLSALARSWCG